jgi:hypothetical protein
MPDRFVALNVGTGDAFLLERPNFSVLVDGGQDTGFPRLFTRTAGRDGVDVLVCTHNDRDHANGIVEFLDDGLTAEEAWLPATWLDALEDLLDQPEEVFFDVLLREEDEDGAATSGATKGAKDGDTGGDGRTPKPARDGDEVTAEAVERLLDREAARDPRHDDLLPHGPGGVVVHRSGRKLWTYGFHARAAAGFDLLLDAANIRRIAIAATRKRVRIRWFDPEQAPHAAAPAGPLQVVNAAEVRAIRRTALSPRDVLRLTQINRDSLVLYAPGSANAPPVFFAADSGLDIAALPGNADMIVTAPHHGSRDPENVAAYAKLAAAHGAPTAATWTWVRSDKRMVAGGIRPCDAYLGQPHRFCTNCRGTGTSQSVVLSGAGGAWAPAGGVMPCACSRP